MAKLNTLFGGTLWRYGGKSFRQLAVIEEELIVPKKPCKVDTRVVGRGELEWTWTCGKCGFITTQGGKMQLLQAANRHWKESKHTGVRSMYRHIGPSIGHRH